MEPRHQHRIRMNYLMINAAAGSGHDRDIWLSRLASCGVAAEPVQNLNPDGLPSLGKEDRLLAVGGDGTMRRMASFCIARGCVLGVLPGGTGNDFARGLGIPLEPQEACRTVAAGVVRRVDIGRAGDDAFLNVAHVGLGSEIGQDVASPEKRWWGRFSYLLRVLERFKRHRGIKATILCGQAQAKGRWLEIAVANGSSFGGGHRVFEASPCDGELDVVAIRPHPPFRLLAIWVRAQLRGASPVEDEAVVHLRSDNCRIVDCRRHAVSADGELIGDTPLRFQVEPKALRVIVPPPQTT